uniref:Cnox-3 n=1 Tax=Eleutheria dichotoma TaxID=13050 RepID=Q24780_9CNID|nr:Cnox3 homeodomain protein [Eleutheria dichotoma]ABE68630.1 Cnox-3 [Eleutheria dichotoma]
MNSFNFEDNLNKDALYNRHPHVQNYSYLSINCKQPNDDAYVYNRQRVPSSPEIHGDTRMEQLSQRSYQTLQSRSHETEAPDYYSYEHIDDANKTLNYHYMNKNTYDNNTWQNNTPLSWHHNITSQPAAWHSTQTNTTPQLDQGYMSWNCCYVDSKRKRTSYSRRQIFELENEFNRSRYITREKRIELSMILNLTERQVKTWFQNRRMKTKKEKTMDDTSNDCSIKSKT